MKWLRIILIVVPVLIIAAVLVLFWRLDAIVRSTVETQATAQLGVPTTLAGANVSVFGGTVALRDFAVGSPKGFDAPRMLQLGGTKLAVAYSELNDQPIRVRAIEVNQPTLVIEQKDLALNFKALIDQMPKSEPSPAETGEPVRLIIDDLKINGAAVVVRSGIPGVQQQIDLKLPDFAVKNIGNAEGAQNGAAVRDVVLVVIAALADAAAKSEQLPPELRQLLNLNVEQLAREKLQGVQKEIGRAVEDVLKDPTKAQDVGKQLEKGLKDVIGGKKDRND
jgi:uncharacterized protein involved in outer membrane biogenesis